MRLCLARVVTPRLTRAMGGPPYFRPYGAQAFTRAVSASARMSVPRFWRIYLALWLISRWRFPATPCLILPVAVSLKRFLTPLLVFSLGIFVSLLRPREVSVGRDVIQPPRHAFWPGHWFFQRSGKRGAIETPLPIGKERVDGNRRTNGHGRSNPSHCDPRPQSRRGDRFLQAGVRGRRTVATSVGRWPA